jgi:hypothetical protein
VTERPPHASSVRASSSGTAELPLTPGSGPVSARGRRSIALPARVDPAWVAIGLLTLLAAGLRFYSLHKVPDDPF